MNFYPSIKQLMLSNSSLLLFDNCARKFEFKKLFECAPDDTGLDAEVGNALHRAYQAYLITRNEEQAIFELLLAYPYLLNCNPLNDRSVEAAYATLMSIIQAQSLINYEVVEIIDMEGVKRPAIEVPFELIIKGFSLADTEEIPVSFIGYIDAILFNNETGEYCVADIKTHRNRLLDLTPEYLYAMQCLPYALVLQRMLNLELQGFDVHYIAAYVDIQEPRTQLYTFNKTMEDVSDWARFLLLKLNELKFMFNTGWFPRKNGHCVNFMKACPYLDFCCVREHEDARRLAEINIDNKRKPYVFKPWVQIELELTV